MESQLMLTAKRSSLELIIAENSWCNLRLHHETSEELGADTLEVITSRFLPILDFMNFPEPTHSLNGNHGKYFISLFENHDSGFVCIRDEEIVITFRSDDGKTFGTLELENQHVQLWRDKLRSLQIK